DKTTKMLKYSENAVGENRRYRFSRVLVAPEYGTVTMKVYDNTQHNIKVADRESGWVAVDKTETSAEGKEVTSQELEPGTYKVTCSMHAWELGWVYTTQHAAFGVTGCDLDTDPVKDHGKARTNDGKVTIANLAVGKYKVEVIHDGKVIETGDVEIKKDEAATYAAKSL
ncbi:MAG: hypothetical protein KDB07_12280, partial [Planctomycetes bacterium]|nr:hypothetical protein [Planctomycetota bacterium]